MADNECKKIADTIRSTATSLFKLNIENNVLNLIAEYSRGTILNCSNTWCSNEVLILSEHTCDGDPNRPKPKPRTSRILQADGSYKEYVYHPSGDRTYKIPDRSFNDIKFKIKYYYDKEQQIAYCYECRKVMLLCCKDCPMLCDELVFATQDKNIKNDTYILCACPGKVKMCLKHHWCKRCNLSGCCSWSPQDDDNCEPRNCDDCTQSGCLNCIEMVSYEECMECDPPRYEGAVYKCKNDQCIPIIPTIFTNNEDYANFKYKYDALKESKMIMGLNIEDTIVIEIAEYCAGRILKCKNYLCDNEVLVLNEHKLIPYDSENDEGFEDALKNKNYTYQDSRYKNIKYIYRPWGDIIYCHICTVGNKASEPNPRILYLPSMINVTNE